MLATLIQIYDKKNIISFQERESNRSFTGCQDARFYDCINTIYMYQFIRPFLNDKISIFEEYGAFN